MLLIDDALLLDVLANTAAPELLEARRRGELGTTGSVVLEGDPSSTWRWPRGAVASNRGPLPSRPGCRSCRRGRPAHRDHHDQPPPPRPDHGSPARPANLLTLEAVAAARLLEAELLVSTTSSLREDLAASARSGSGCNQQLTRTPLRACGRPVIGTRCGTLGPLHDRTDVCAAGGRCARQNRQFSLDRA